MLQWAKDCLIVGRKRQNNTSFLDNGCFLDRTQVVANCFYCKCSCFPLNSNYMFLGIFYYTTSESKLPTFFQILPAIVRFFPLPRARARQVVFFFCLHFFTGCYISLSLSEIGVKTFVFYPSPFHATRLVPADCSFSPVSC